MAAIARKSDGRRIFSAAFKREQIERLLRGELSLAELSRRLRVAPSLLHRWKRLASPAPAPTDGLDRFVIPVSTLRDDPYVRELTLLVGKQTLELEILRAELVALRKGPPPVGRRPEGRSS
jgi:transposase-like protein